MNLIKGNKSLIIVSKSFLCVHDVAMSPEVALQTVYVDGDAAGGDNARELTTLRAGDGLRVVDRSRKALADRVNTKVLAKL